LSAGEFSNESLPQLSVKLGGRRIGSNGFDPFDDLASPAWLHSANAGNAIIVSI
jgi:hypothetical protein